MKRVSKGVYEYLGWTVKASRSSFYDRINQRSGSIGVWTASKKGRRSFKVNSRPEAIARIDWIERLYALEAAAKGGV